MSAKDLSTADLLYNYDVARDTHDVLAIARLRGEVEKRMAGAAPDVEKLAREIAPLIEWLEKEAVKVTGEIKARRDGANMRNATAKEIKAGKRLAEKIMGHKLTHVSGTVEENIRYCDIQDRIATKLETEARQLSNWADVLRRSLQPPAGADEP